MDFLLLNSFPLSSELQSGNKSGTKQMRYIYGNQLITEKKTKSLTSCTRRTTITPVAIPFAFLHLFESAT